MFQLSKYSLSFFLGCFFSVSFAVIPLEEDFPAYFNRGAAQAPTTHVESAAKPSLGLMHSLAENNDSVQGPLREREAVKACACGTGLVVAHVVALGKQRKSKATNS